MALGSGHRDCISQSTLGLGALTEGISNGPEGGGISHVGGVGIVALETSGQLIGVVEDLFETAGHGFHLKYLGRAGVSVAIGTLMALLVGSLS